MFKASYIASFRDFEPVETDLISPDYIRYVPNTWNVFHIQSVVPNMRFKIIKAEDELGFSPQRLDL